MARTEIEAFIAEHALTVTAVFVPCSQSRNAQSAHPSLNWKVTVSVRGCVVLDGVDYSAGSGHCPAYIDTTAAHGAYDRAEMMKWECEHGKRAKLLPGGSIVAAGSTVGRVSAILPDPVDVVACLASDAGALDAGSFEEWARDMGEDTDSRKAEACYRACLETALALRAALGEAGLTALRQACQDY